MGGPPLGLSICAEEPLHDESCMHSVSMVSKAVTRWAKTQKCKEGRSKSDENPNGRSHRIAI